MGLTRKGNGKSRWCPADRARIDAEERNRPFAGAVNESAVTENNARIHRGQSLRLSILLEIEDSVSFGAVKYGIADCAKALDVQIILA